VRFLSVCSGIEAASVAWNPLGWKAVAFSEIEPFPCALLKHHYPDTPNFGDMTKYKEWSDDLSIDLLCGGTPCQSFSVAGLRKGLDDPRGNLMLTFGAIAAKYRPQWLVWENVPGVLSSNGGADFGSFLGMLGELGYGFAYRVLDAQYFGVAQRRRRVFVVGCFGDWRSAAAVLFERHGLSGNPAPRRQAGQTITSTIRAGAANGGAGHGARSGDSKDELIVPVAQTLRAQAQASHRADTETYIPVETLCISTGQAGAEIGADMAPTLNCNHEAPYVIAGVMPFDTTQITSIANYSNPKSGDPCHPLAAGGHAPAIAFSAGDHGNDAAFDVSPTMRKGGDGGGNQPAIAYSTKLHNTNSNQAGKVYEEYTVGLDRNSPPPALLMAMQVRRLTPMECERLQGFPDLYTAIPLRGKPAADGPRYKALGNSWAIPNVRWIGERIDAVVEIRKTQMDAA
jgi:DNA (cytosine-5)-methyltransferase 1